MTNSPPSGSADPERDRTSTAFGLLHERVRRWIWEQGWAQLHDIQERSIPVIIEGTRDVILAAATAGGKTEAAFLPICSRLVDASGGSIRALYIGPLRALINDQFRRLELLCRDLHIPVHRWHGDVPQGRKREVIKQPSGILLITPESLEALFVLRGPQVQGMFASLDHIVVDEIHAYPGSERGRQLQSLMHRLELALRRRVPRIGLSATLGDMALAKSFLRPQGGERVEVLVSRAEGQELRLVLKGYREVPEPDSGERVVQEPHALAKFAIAASLYDALRGDHNLVFANSRGKVEWYADQLRHRSEQARVPNEFFPHHGSLARELREVVEGRLKDGTVPTTVVCTSTLEMGIDIGAVKCIAQVGVPPSVASLRQRLGRSGRRPGDPAILRAYVIEPAVDQDTLPQHSIRRNLVETIAMVRLLLQGWCEPPHAGAFHLSTLVQQILSVIAQHGGVAAADAWRALCESGPFASTDKRMFAAVLRSLGQRDVLTQLGDGSLTLGLAGEKVVGHYTFYAAFQTPEEWTLVGPEGALGAMPIGQLITEGDYIIFAGRRWKIRSLDEERHVAHVVPSGAGREPPFDGSGAMVHQRVREEMYAVYVGEEVPAFLDPEARSLLAEGREWFRRLELDKRMVIEHGGGTIVFPWTGDAAALTLRLIATAAGFDCYEDGVSLTLRGTAPDEFVARMREVCRAGLPEPRELAAGMENLVREKHDRYLSDELLLEDAAAKCLDTRGARLVLERM